MHFEQVPSTLAPDVVEHVKHLIEQGKSRREAAEHASHRFGVMRPSIEALVQRELVATM